MPPSDPSSATLDAPESILSALAARYRSVRLLTEKLAAPLEPEDYVLQSMPDASPVKWHLAHTTWFFETFLLAPNLPGYKPFDDRFGFLFNSYYNAVGDRIPRARRGLLGRPTVHDVLAYRTHVDEAMARLLSAGDLDPDASALILLGTHHEQQHQELIATDLKHAFSLNPLQPSYHKQPPPAPPRRSGGIPDVGWIEFGEGLREIGHTGPGFSFDNECPRHRVFVPAFQLADRPATNRDYLRFIDDGGYSRPEFWLSEGWETCRSQGWQAPLYWERKDSEWWTFTLSGPLPVDLDEPVVHLSYFEADAFARWSGCRLPTEAEWETASAEVPLSGHLLDPGLLHPSPAPSASPGSMLQLYGDVWEWTSSPYTAYPGFRPAAGAVGEYNGKFMCSQFVLRGGSCATPPGHLRPTYRNFFPPSSRWQFSGLRLARDPE